MVSASYASQSLCELGAAHRSYEDDAHSDVVASVSISKIGDIRDIKVYDKSIPSTQFHQHTFSTLFIHFSQILKVHNSENHSILKRLSGMIT